MSKINDKILSIPPYISTSWGHITAIHMKDGQLVITLDDNSFVSIPSLPPNIIETIFEHHAAYLERVNSEVVKQKLQKTDPLNIIGGTTFRFGMESMDGLTNAMQHNPEQANAPDLPQEMLQKISSISKILAPDDALLPKAEPSCNCFHCQIARAISGSTIPIQIQESHEVNDRDLTFQQWNISQTGDKLFSVTNRLDENEKYNVFLGEPVGCTCGQSGCEHIIAVLKS